MFDENKLYSANDPELRPLGSYMTLAHWRNEGRGPSYIKLGRRIGYTGKALNEWLSRQTVTPTACGSDAGAAGGN